MSSERKSKVVSKTKYEIDSQSANFSYKNQYTESKDMIPPPGFEPGTMRFLLCYVVEHHQSFPIGKDLQPHALPG